MRHIVYLLLVANLVYLGWNLFQGQTINDDEALLPPMPDGVRRLVTLQEYASGPTSSVDAAALDALTAARPPGAVSAQNCNALGPFSALAEARSIAGRLSDMGLESVQRSVDSQEENGYWVYLPAMERDQSREIVQQLKARGDHDYYVGKDYFISLGTFEVIDRAKIRLKELRKLGFEAKLGKRYKARKEYWLELPNSEAAGNVLAIITTENPELQLHALSCK